MSRRCGSSKPTPTPLACEATKLNEGTLLSVLGTTFCVHHVHIPLPGSILMSFPKGYEYEPCPFRLRHRFAHKYEAFLQGATVIVLRPCSWCDNQAFDDLVFNVSVFAHYRYVVTRVFFVCRPADAPPLRAGDGLGNSGDSFHGMFIGSEFAAYKHCQIG